MKIYYRISDNSYDKNKLEWATKEYCLKNFVDKFYYHKDQISIIADNVSDETLEMIYNYIPKEQVTRTYFGHGALSLNFTMHKIYTLDDNEIVYVVEDDYLHRDNSDAILVDGLNRVGAHFVSLYDHPDKYLNPSEGGNPHCSGRSEVRRVYLGEYSHYKLTNSTTMTFASKVKTIKQFFPILQKWTSQKHNSTYPYDYYMFAELIRSGATIITPIPTYSTHTESKWLSPLINWEDV